MEKHVLDNTSRLSSLSIVVDDVDEKGTKPVVVESRVEGVEERVRCSPEVQTQIQWTHNPYPKHVLMAASEKIMNDAARRKRSFSKLIDEHEALVKYVAKMEQENHSLNSMCGITKPTIMT
ncbi:hypothetical protein JTB14_017367 [Gonioctena quinquepunctata]|nr:hypothetical protein JTB14_017367 [Gonioctena quinquepunctata]